MRKFCAECEHFSPHHLWRPLDPLLDSNKLFVLVGECKLPLHTRTRDRVQLAKAVTETDYCNHFTLPKDMTALFDSDEFPEESEVVADAKTEGQQEQTEEDPRQLHLPLR